jgi:hypothetical protein
VTVNPRSKTARQIKQTASSVSNSACNGFIYRLYEMLDRFSKDSASSSPTDTPYGRLRQPCKMNRRKVDWSGLRFAIGRRHQGYHHSDLTLCQQSVQPLTISSISIHRYCNKNQWLTEKCRHHLDLPASASLRRPEW